jgi:SAM-dependent methyltransferase
VLAAPPTAIIRSMSDLRTPQLEYSNLQSETRNEATRRTKAEKIRAVLQHFVGCNELTGLTILDIGCSTGFTASELSRTGAHVVGMDIDIPGLTFAIQHFGPEVKFLRGDGAAVPFADQSFDVIVFNHIYEHALDADGVLAEIRRILRPDGVVYLGLGNKYGVIEPHYKLPFLSWLPPKVADLYVEVSGRAPRYHERFRTRSGLLRMCATLNLWDYTYTVLCDPDKFGARDMVPRRLTRAPEIFWRLLAPIVPTFIWIGTPGVRRPEGVQVRHPPDYLSS